MKQIALAIILASMCIPTISLPEFKTYLTSLPQTEYKTTLNQAIETYQKTDDARSLEKLLIQPINNAQNIIEQHPYVTAVIALYIGYILGAHPE